MGIFNSNKIVIGLSLVLTAVGLGLAGSSLVPGRALAAGETYVYDYNGGETKQKITVSGGDLKKAATLNYTGKENGVAGLVTSQIAGTVTYKTGCTFKMSIGVAALDLTQGQIDHASGGTCSSSVTQPYLGKTVPLRGAVATSGHIVVTDAAPDDKNPPTSETISIKSADGSKTYSTQSQDTGVCNTGAVEACHWDIDFPNPNGLKAYDYEACSKVLNDCAKGHKIAGVSASIDLGSFCKATDSVGSDGICVPDPDATTDPGTADGGLDCAGGDFSWAICPFIDLATSAATKLDGLISSLLTLDVTQTFGGDNSTGYYTAWNSFRILSTALLVIAGLVMVTSQALGFEALDAYTIRKVLPRLLIAVIGMSLSWPLMKFMVVFFNTLGQDVQGLIQGPFNAIHGTINPGIGVTSTLATILGSVAIVTFFGPAALLFIVSGFLSLFIAFFILVIRQIGVTLAVILAPIAIACYILPNTQKVWNLWRENFFGLLMMFPIVMAFITTGHVFAVISLKHGGGISQVIGLIAYFAPYFLLPLAFKLATGLIANLTGMVNDRGKGAFDRMKAARQKKGAENFAKMKSGSRFSERNALTRGFNATTAGAATGVKGRFGTGSRGRAARDIGLRAAAAERAKDPLMNQLQFDDDGIAAMSLSAGSASHARAALRAQGWDESRIEKAVAAANSVGINRENAAAAIDMMARNKNFSLASGQTGTNAVAQSIAAMTGSTWEQDAETGKYGFSGGNKQMAENMLGSFQFNSRQSGRFDNGANDMTQSWGKAGVGQHAQGTAASLKSFAEHFAGKKTVDASGRTVVTGSMLDASRSVDERREAAIALMEMQNMLPNASADNQKIINETLQGAGIDHNSSVSIEDQLSALSGGAASGAVIRGRARVYDSNTPTGARGPGDPTPPPATPAGG